MCGSVQLILNYQETMLLMYASEFVRVRDHLIYYDSIIDDMMANEDSDVLRFEHFMALYAIDHRPVRKDGPFDLLHF
jgi:hypothetical protein